ncbi:MAG: 2-oxoglutarate dehydrogenase E1 subunit family protein, partial [Acidimicrobiales bacterium]
MTSTDPARDRAPVAADGRPRAATGSFGPNAWLVDDMYDRYLADPASVGESWRDFFADYHPAPLPSPMETLAREVAASRPPDLDTGDADADGSVGRQAGAGNGRVPGAGSNGHDAPVSTVPGSAGGAQVTTAESPGAAAPSAPATGAPAGTAAAVAQPQEAPASERSEGEDRPTPLRGAASRIAANMTASLSVPTATSVRTVPAKLLEVNRQILNNQLARTTGAKVSLTHLIGYAVVRGLQAVPALNSSY